MNYKKNERDYLILLSYRIKEILKKTEHEKLIHRDYVFLSESIKTATKIYISISTLKRIIGNPKKCGIPHTDNLNALCKYIGFANWYDFIKNVKIKKVIPNEKRNKIKPVIYILSLFFIALIILLLFLFRNIIFTSKIPEYKIICENPKGIVPHTFIFKHEIDEKHLDDFQLKFTYSRNIIDFKPISHYFNHTINIPGNFFAYIIFKQKVIDSIELNTRTDGWFLYRKNLANNKEPLLLKFSNNKKGVLCFPGTIQTDIDLEDKYYFLNFKDEKFNNKHLVFRTDFLINDTAENLALHKKIVFGLFFEEGIIDISFTKKELTNNVHLILGKSTVGGTYNDLSNFYYHSDNMWNNFELITKEDEIIIYLNNKKIFTKNYSENLGNYIGININSMADVFIDNLKLYSSGQIIIDDDFE